MLITKVAVRIDDDIEAGSSLDGTFGWGFSVNRTIRVTQLGILDQPNSVQFVRGDGLAFSHAVALWTSTGNLLAQVTIPAGASGNVVDHFRYVPLTRPVILPPGSYVVGAFYPAPRDQVYDEFSHQYDPVITAFGITYTGGRRVDGSALAFPSMVDDSSGTVVLQQYFGPNFQFVESYVVTFSEALNTTGLILKRAVDYFCSSRLVMTGVMLVIGGAMISVFAKSRRNRPERKR